MMWFLSGGLREGSVSIESGQALLLPTPGNTTTINLLEFLSLHRGQQSWAIRCLPNFSAHCPHTPHRLLYALQWMQYQWQEHITDTVYLSIYNTQHCSPWLQSHVLALSLMSPKAQRSFAICRFTNCQVNQISHSGCTAIPIHFEQKIAGSLQCNPDETG